MPQPNAKPYKTYLTLMMLGLGLVFNCSAQNPLADNEFPAHKSGTISITQAAITEAWSAATMDWINEPSGLTVSGLVDPNFEDHTILLAVDDDEPLIFVLLSLNRGDGHKALLARRSLRMSHRGKQFEPDDLEGIAYAGGQQYFAITSHRRLDKKKLTYLFAFNIHKTHWSSPDYEIQIDRLYDLKQGQDDGSLAFFLKRNGIAINLERWKSEGEDENKRSATVAPFEVEIEGLAYRNNELLMGLKWPTVSENGMKMSLLVTYDLDEGRFKKLYRLNIGRSDRGDYGITGLSHEPVTDRLYVAFNPPRKGVRGQTATFYGKSGLYAFGFDKSGGLTDPSRINIPKITTSKLEGIAVHDQSLWLVYDGDIPSFQGIELPNPKPR